jgi:hypothetical protein
MGGGDFILKFVVYMSRYVHSERRAGLRKDQKCLQQANSTGLGSKLHYGRDAPVMTQTAPFQLHRLRWP